ncbi:hypothetical protein GGX14DRAFT_390279 [Mycena pura]|uniref:Uncharacterized protein n=1 Tax=Mycena pura TaxID=153505 RepID=A0AAD6VST2_9AGAR|nr:hypothetical protein GGX14DRAFT_390279 [Mycena pura]
MPVTIAFSRCVRCEVALKILGGKAVHVHPEGNRHTIGFCRLPTNQDIGWCSLAMGNYQLPEIADQRGRAEARINGREARMCTPDKVGADREGRYVYDFPGACLPDPSLGCNELCRTRAHVLPRASARDGFCFRTIAKARRWMTNLAPMYWSADRHRGILKDLRAPDVVGAAKRNDRRRNEDIDVYQPQSRNLRRVNTISAEGPVHRRRRGRGMRAQVFPINVLLAWDVEAGLGFSVLNYILSATKISITRAFFLGMISELVEFDPDMLQRARCLERIRQHRERHLLDLAHLCRTAPPQWRARSTSAAVPWRALYAHTAERRMALVAPCPTPSERDPVRRRENYPKRGQRPRDTR